MPMMQKTLAEVLTVARASAGTVFDAAGNLTTVAANLPRFDYDPVTKAFKGLLIEEQRTNLILNSTAATAVDGALVDSGYANSPAGTQTALRLRNTPNVSSRLGIPASALPDGTYTRSLFVKPVGQNSTVVFEGVGGPAGNGGALSFDAVAKAFSGNTSLPIAYGYSECGNGWLRVWVTAAKGPANIFSSALYIGSYGAGAVQHEFLAWGFQVEAGAFMTSHIPTSGAAATRAADVVQVIDGLWRGNSAHTLYVEASRPQISFGVFAALRTAGGGNEIFIETGAGNPAQQRVRVSAASVQQALISTSASAVAGQAYKMAGTVSSGRAAFAQDGVLIGAQAGVQLPSVQMLVLGSGATSGFLNGHIRNVQYTDRVLSDADLIAVSLKGLAA